MIEIKSTSYNVQAGRTLVGVQVSERLTDKVFEVKGYYKVELQGEYNPGDDAIYDAVVGALTEAGVSVMPVLG